MKHLTAILAALVLLVIGLACSGDEREKANGLVNEANKFVAEANEQVRQAEAKATEYDAKLNQVDSDQELKELREFGKGIMEIYDSMKASFEKAGAKFEEASKLNINEKAKEYLGIKANEMKKRAEYSTEVRKIPQALIESKNRQEYVGDAKKFGANARKLLEEANEIAEKANKLSKENPTQIMEPGK
jgi:uncharacterized protein YxeA